MSDRQHSIFAPSSSATWIPCSYSARNAVPDAPKKESTRVAAKEGDRVHSLFEAAISQMEMPDDGDTAAEAIALGVSYVRQLEPSNRLLTEYRVTLTPECWGTTDLFNDHHRVATVLDVKNGKWDVDAYHNKQMLSYSAMLLDQSQAEWWRLVIFQPNGLNETPFKQWIAHRSEVEAHRQVMYRAMADRSAPNPGPHCRWCKAFQSCPAMTTDAGFVMGAMTRRVEDLTTQELVRLLRLVRALHDNKEMYEEALTTHLKMGRTADGATLKQGRAWRAWNDPVQAARYLQQHYGEKGVKPITPAQAEKLGVAGKAYASVGMGSHKPPGDLKASY